MGVQACETCFARRFSILIVFEESALGWQNGTVDEALADETLADEALAMQTWGSKLHTYAVPVCLWL